MPLQYLLSLVCIVCIYSLKTLFLPIALQYILSLEYVCIVCCDSVIYVTFTNGFTIYSIFGMHYLLLYSYICYFTNDFTTSSISGINCFL